MWLFPLAAARRARRSELQKTQANGATSAAFLGVSAPSVSCPRTVASVGGASGGHGGVVWPLGVPVCPFVAGNSPAVASATAEIYAFLSTLPLDVNSSTLGPGLVVTKTPGRLFVGTLAHALDETLLQSLSIGIVLTAAWPFGSWPCRQRELYKKLGILHYVHPLLDDPSQGAEGGGISSWGSKGLLRERWALRFFEHAREKQWPMLGISVSARLHAGGICPRGLLDLNRPSLSGLWIFAFLVPLLQLLRFDNLSLGSVREALMRGTNVFIHCEKGISRSVAVCMAYLIMYEGHSFRSSYLTIRRYRPIARPNIGFIHQLLDLEAQIGSSESMLHDRHRRPSQGGAPALTNEQREAALFGKSEKGETGASPSNNSPDRVPPHGQNPAYSKAHSRQAAAAAGRSGVAVDPMPQAIERTAVQRTVQGVMVLCHNASTTGGSTLSGQVVVPTARGTLMEDEWRHLAAVGSHALSEPLAFSAEAAATSSAAAPPTAVTKGLLPKRPCWGSHSCRRFRRCFSCAAATTAMVPVSVLPQIQGMRQYGNTAFGLPTGALRYTSRLECPGTAGDPVC
ncbi:uncharacterized protein LOC34623518 [Cyclospora cayetanensis]|uniref:protein-tyrosine-phosphatase n=1 Tax=Cyclospora cayetanensis TaxID=88456 RepID=A0A6P6RST8_9EIME|nr:uncharacterized protein LOC34623518 [Cyclospora cayetanensis]